MTPLSRRRFLRTLGGGVAGSALLGAYAWGVEPHWPAVVHRTMPLAGLPGALVGKTLVQVSDLHVGQAVDTDYLVRALRGIADLRPDLLVVTGDFVSAGHHVPPDLDRVLDALPAAPLGRFASFGNHDHGHRWRQPQLADALAEALERRGVEALRNAQTDVAGLPITGLDDYWSLNFFPERVLPTLPTDRDALVLTHNPDTADLPVWGAVRGWLLAGHTHGGQVKPPFLPPPLLPVRNRRYTQGAFDVGSNRRLYVNPGLGYLHRVRFNARPEITVFTLADEAGDTR